MVAGFRQQARGVAAVNCPRLTRIKSSRRGQLIIIGVDHTEGAIMAGAAPKMTVEDDSGEPAAAPRI